MFMNFYSENSLHLKFALHTACGLSNCELNTLYLGGRGLDFYFETPKSMQLFDLLMSHTFSLRACDYVILIVSFSIKLSHNIEIIGNFIVIFSQETLFAVESRIDWEWTERLLVFFSRIQIFIR